MPTQNPIKIKDNILSILRRKGPSLPVHVAKEIEMSILFASAFLSELLSEKTIKITNMKVGGSPVYYLPGQERYLEKYSQHLKSKEKEAFLLLQQKKFLKDKDQNPAIRVALRSINDFAFPFKKNNELYWRYFTAPESDFIVDKPKKEEIVEKKIKEKEKSERITKSTIKVGRDFLEEPQKTQKTKTLNIFDKKEKSKKKTIKKKPVKKTNDKFFNKVKEFLSQKSIEILDIESFSKKDIILKVNSDRGERLIVAYNKKRINENDIVNAHKKALELNLKYDILSLGDHSKKLDNLIKAIKNLSQIERVK